MEFYSTVQIDAHTWMIKDCFQSYMYLLEGDTQAVLIDSGIGLPGLREYVGRLTQKPVIVINTHGHLDHVGGNCQFEKYYMMQTDHEILQEHTDPVFRKHLMEGFAQECQLPFKKEELEELAKLGDMPFFFQIMDGQVFDLGSRTLEVIATPGHTIGSVCILDRERRNLFSADTVCDQGILLFFTHSASVREYLKSIRSLQERRTRFERIWPGHHSLPLGLDYLEMYEECAEQILTRPERGEDICSNLGEGKLWRMGRVSITYQLQNL